MMSYLKCTAQSDFVAPGRSVPCPWRDIPSWPKSRCAGPSPPGCAEHLDEELANSLVFHPGAFLELASLNLAFLGTQEVLHEIIDADNPLGCQTAFLPARRSSR